MQTLWDSLELAKEESNSVYAGAAVLPGAGTGTSEPSLSPPGSLVSKPGPRTGDILLGSSTNYVECYPNRKRQLRTVLTR